MNSNPDQATTPNFQLKIDTVGASEHSLSLEFPVGRITFVMGANGTGKSSFIGLLAKNFVGKTSRIAAYRQVTLAGSAVSMTGNDRATQEDTRRIYYQENSFRYQDHLGANTNNAAIYDIFSAQNFFHQEQNSKYSNIKFQTADAEKNWQKINSDRGPIERIESILRGAGLALSFNFDRLGSINVVRGASTPYGIREMSDGERAAFLLSSMVITAAAGQLILIDEPERHLHRSISSPLIHGLLRERPDCAFVVSTHDTSLPLDQPDCSAVLLRAYQYDPQKWDAEYVSSVESLDEDVAEAILGSRKNIIFVEGERSSLDHALYSQLYPSYTVRSQKSCADVINATRGVNETRDEHRVQAIGIVDRDRRSPDDVTKLAAHGVVALDVHSIESVYYHPKVVRLVAMRLDTAGLLKFADIDAQIECRMIEAFNEKRDVLVKDAVVRRIRESVLSMLPKAKDLDGASMPSAGLTSEDIASLYRDEAVRFDELVVEKQAEKLCAVYAVKRTRVPKAVCDLLNLKDSATFTETVRRMAMDDASAADAIRGIVGPLTQRVIAAANK